MKKLGSGAFGEIFKGKHGVASSRLTTFSLVTLFNALLRALTYLPDASLLS